VRVMADSVRDVVKMMVDGVCDVARVMMVCEGSKDA
jgi:hypothetical protein